MDPKLYYTKEELMVIPHFNFVDTDTNLYMHQKNGDFEIYKKLFLLKPNASELTEIYVELKVYMVIVAHLRNSKTRWLNVLDAYVFYNIKDYFECLDEANKNRLF